MNEAFRSIDLISDREFHNRETWVNEALFGYEQLKEYFAGMRDGAHALEIGCGAGLLLSILKEEFPRLSFEGVEPFGDGFSQLAEINAFVKQQGVEIHNVPYESFIANKKFDLIFCVNVFEHLGDWRHFLRTVNSWLTPGGKCVVLCPNYGFPYESHFRIPLLFNKAITQFVFGRYIENFERRNQCEGLWKSLNLVRKKDIRKYAKTETSLTYRDRIDILEKMILRLSTDAEFRKRQWFIGILGIAVRKLNLLSLFRLFPNRAPYMMLEFEN